MEREPFYMFMDGSGRHRKEESTPPEWWLRKVLSTVQPKQQMLISALEAVATLLNRHKIVWWLCGGSLLGALRHQGFIPTDDDVDISVWAEELPILRQCVESTFADVGICRFGDAFWEGKCFASLTFFDNTPHRIVIDVWPIGEDCSPSTSELAREVLPLRMVPFAGLESVPIPALSEDYLERVYPSWKTECVIWAHGDNFSNRNVWRVALSEYLVAIASTAYIAPTEVLPVGHFALLDALRDAIQRV